MTEQDQCLRKCGYEKYDRAEKKARLVEQKKGKKMHVYKCPFCFKWHIGHVTGVP